MHHRLVAATVTSIFASAPLAAWACPPAGPQVELLIDLQDDTDDADERALERLLGGRDLVLNSIHSADERFFLVSVPERVADLVLEKLAADPRVEHAERNYTYSLPAEVKDAFAEVDAGDAEPAKGPRQPNDPLYSKQWSFRMVGAAEAWAKADGKGVTVAVIDTGVAFENHGSFRQVEDLAGATFAKGYDFVNDDEHANDDHGHGTHVAGTIAQTTNNGVGVAGLAPKATIMPLKVLSARGSGSAADIADAIRFAADEGADVINMSLGGGMRSLVMQTAVAYARKKGVVVVCAAGNNSRRKVEFPAAYKGAFAVSSVGPDRKLAFYSSYGKQIAISAPGGDKRKGGEAGGILQNTIQPGAVSATNQYLAFQGTSMATPHVAGAAALVMSTGVTNPDDVERILRETATDAGAKGWDDKYGHGILNVADAVSTADAETSGGWHLLSALAALAGFAWRFRRRLALASLLPGATLGAVLGGSGLFFLSGLLPSVLTEAMPNWDRLAFGASGHTLLWASALPVVGFALLGLGRKALRPVIVGLALGWAAHLAVAAAFGVTDVAWLPGAASWLDRAWLVVNAGVLAGFAALVGRLMAARR